MNKLFTSSISFKSSLKCCFWREARAGSCSAVFLLAEDRPCPDCLISMCIDVLRTDGGRGTDLISSPQRSFSLQLQPLVAKSPRPRARREAVFISAISLLSRHTSRCWDGNTTTSDFVWEKGHFWVNSSHLTGEAWLTTQA